VTTTDCNYYNENVLSFNNDLNIPSIITFDGDNRVITLYTNSNNDKGVYFVAVIGSFSNYGLTPLYAYTYFYLTITD
jgi:hypothetical protein